ncbi:kinesin-like protein klp-3 [Amia ocellicauda]|uniref:kinesin-like protein klp-3 n=1 Tax=Amia ocellicauda TaxID=2972642 RepID=UPI003464B4A4
MEKDRIIEDLEQKLQDKEKEMDDLVQKNNYLSEEYRYLSEDLQPLYGRVAELEADKEEASEKIRALLATRPTGPDADLAPKPSVNSSQLLQVGTLIRDLNIANKSLRSTVKHMFSEMGHQMEQLLKAALRMKEAQQNSTTDFEELRSLYRREAMERKALYNKLQELCGNIRVFCRCRGDSAADTCLDVPSDEEVIVNQKGSKKTFFFDKVYPSSATQEEVFNEARAIITSCVDGYNVCILAYGQTGSGKTYTMMGPKGNPGVNIRSIRELLHICKQRETITYVLKISMLEIYNESLNDLLALNQTSQLEIQTRGKAVTVHGLTQIEVNTEDDILNIVELGEQNRTTASTKINIESSRSHLIVTLHVDGTDSASGVTSHGSLMLCDLAGSERISKTEATGQRLVEAAAINKSLTSLGQVFSALKCNALHVPFRNSKLTRLLQPSLSGDAKACVFLNVSPDMNNLAETLSTLQFGSSIRQVELGRATQHTSPGRDTQ